MTRNIYILLTRFPDHGAKIIEAMTGSYYSHASIGLEEDLNTFYSFRYKGFMVEKATRYLRPGREPYPCQLYEFTVSEQVYRSIKELLAMFVERKCSLRYSRLGLVLSLLRVPYKRRYYYFCSQFIAEILHYSQAYRLKKSSTLYFPCDLGNLPGMRLAFHGTMSGMIDRFELSPCPA